MQSKLGYFKNIKRAKASYRADFLAKTSPNNIWTAKQLVAPRKTPWDPSLPDASRLVRMNKSATRLLLPRQGPYAEQRSPDEEPLGCPPHRRGDLTRALQIFPLLGLRPRRDPLLRVEKAQSYQSLEYPRTPLPLGGVRLPPPITENCKRGGPGQAWQGLL